MRTVTPWLSYVLLAALLGPAGALAYGQGQGGGAESQGNGGQGKGTLPVRQGDDPPARVKSQVGIDPPADAQVPLDLKFVDQAGREVQLREYFRGERPVLLTLVYYRCPSMCGVVLEQQLHALQKLEWSPGQEFQVLTVSINPQETPRLAQEKRRTFLAALDRPTAEQGWNFLTGNEQQIKALADAVGFHYQFDLASQEYAHAAGLFVCTPSGKLSRVLRGVDYPPTTLRLSLVEASEGKVGSLVDQLTLYCYHYDASTGTYSAAVMNIMRLAGLVTVMLLSLGVAFALRRERLRRAATGVAPTSPDVPGRPS